MTRRGVLYAAPALAVGGCEGAGDTTPRGAAETFIDWHYVEIDLARAREYTVGLARRKIDDELRLTSGQPLDADARKPRVYYRLLQQRESGGRTAFVYELTIRPDGAEEFFRRLVVRVRREEAGWRVSNYMEY